MEPIVASLVMASPPEPSWSRRNWQYSIWGHMSYAIWDLGVLGKHVSCRCLLSQKRLSICVFVCYSFFSVTFFGLPHYASL